MIKKSVKKSKIDLILELERKQLKEVRDVDREEHNVEDLERKQLKELDELKKIEESIREKVGEHPLRKITYKDIGKSMIGAFVGIVSHFTVLEGLHFAESISFTKANFFYLISFFVGLIMIYYTGFRKVKDVRLLVILPFRLILIYAVTLISILLVLIVFGAYNLDGSIVYKQVAVLSLPAIIGACAADLIGGE